MVLKVMSGIGSLKKLAVVSLAIVLTAPALAGDATVGNLVISGARARATLPNAPVAGGYLTIANQGTEPDRLLGGSAGFAKRVEIHEMKMEGEVMKMRPLTEGLEIPAGGQVELGPGSYHIMFVKPEGLLKKGESRTAILEFEKAGKVEVQFDIGNFAGNM